VAKLTGRSYQSCILKEHRLETAKVLLSRGADPFMISKYGDDILQTACIKVKTTAD
jgi:hypothetical protein